MSNNYDNQGNFADAAAGATGYETGRVEGDARRGDADVRQGADRAGDGLKQGFESSVQGVKDAPADLAGAVEGAANWVGDKFGGAERDGRDARNDVDQFGAGVGNAYDQGQQQGQQ